MANNERVTEQQAREYLDSFFASLLYNIKVNVDGQEKIIDNYENVLGKSLYDYLTIGQSISPSLLNHQLSMMYTYPLLDVRRSLFSTDKSRDTFFTTTGPKTRRATNRTSRRSLLQSSSKKIHIL